MGINTISTNKQKQGDKASQSHDYVGTTSNMAPLLCSIKAEITTER